MNDVVRTAVWAFLLPAVYIFVVLKVFEFLIGAG
jgi:hypothetical protein